MAYVLLIVYFTAWPLLAVIWFPYALVGQLREWAEEWVDEDGEE